MRVAGVQESVFFRWGEASRVAVRLVETFDALDGDLRTLPHVIAMVKRCFRKANSRLIVPAERLIAFRCCLSC